MTRLRDVRNEQVASWMSALHLRVRFLMVPGSDRSGSSRRAGLWILFGEPRLDGVRAAARSSRGVSAAISSSLPLSTLPSASPSCARISARRVITAEKPTMTASCGAALVFALEVLMISHITPLRACRAGRCVAALGLTSRSGREDCAEHRPRRSAPPAQRRRCTARLACNLLSRAPPLPARRVGLDRVPAGRQTQRLEPLGITGAHFPGPPIGWSRHDAQEGHARERHIRRLRGP